MAISWPCVILNPSRVDKDFDRSGLAACLKKLPSSLNLTITRAVGGAGGGRQLRQGLRTKGQKAHHLKNLEELAHAIP